MLKHFLFDKKLIFWQIVLLFFFVLMMRITLFYIPISSEANFLAIKQTEVTTIPFYLPVFYIHVFSSIFVLLAGFTQFNSKILAKNIKFHRFAGKFYIYFVLLLSAPSGFLIGLYANGGFYSKISFCTLALLWFYFTFKAVKYIQQKNIIDHKKMMYRSYALACSAITLRLWKYILVILFQPSPMDLYQIIAWLGWVPNLIFVEYIFRKKH